MHVLVSGANGYLGSALVPALLASGRVARVTALVRQPGRFATTDFLAGCQLVDMEDCIHGRYGMADVDIFCHLAACRDATTQAEIAGFMALTSDLLVTARRAGVQGIINASSHAVYGVSQPLWDEETPVAPVTPYGIAKYAGELLVKNMARLASPIGTVSLRLAKLVGPAPAFRVAPSELPHVLAHCALTGRPVTLPGAGVQKLDLMDVRDAAAAIVGLVESRADSWPEVMNIGSGRGVSAAEIAGRVSAIAGARHGRPLQYSLSAPGEQKLRDFGMSTARLEKLFGWQASYTLDQTIGDVLAVLARKAPG